MKARIIITDQRGSVFEGEVVLSQSAPSHRKTKKKEPREGSEKPSGASVPDPSDFDLHIRAFVKKYARGMSGPRKFTLLLAHMAKGKTTSSIDLTEIEKQWNKMTTLMDGKFHQEYANRARDDDWVVPLKKGSYVLRPNWTMIFAK